MRFNDLHFASEILQDEKLHYAGGISYFSAFFKATFALWRIPDESIVLFLFAII